MATLTQKQVFHECRRVPSTVLAALCPCIIAPHPSFEPYKIRAVDDVLTAYQMLNDEKAPLAENPLFDMVSVALQNSDGKQIKLMAVPDDTIEAWTLAAAAVRRRTDVYTVVPDTRLLDALAVFHAAANDALLADCGVQRRLLIAPEFAYDPAMAGVFAGRRTHIVAAPGSPASARLACAAIAGLFCAIAPHQPITNIELAGINNWTGLQIDEETESTYRHTWLVRRDAVTDTIHVAHAPSGDNVVVATPTNEVRMRNIDAFTAVIRSRTADFASLESLDRGTGLRLRDKVRTSLSFYTSRSSVFRLGSPIRSSKIVMVRPHASLPQKRVVIVKMRLANSDTESEIPLVI